MIDQKYRIRSNKKLNKRLRKGRPILVIWDDEFAYYSDPPSVLYPKGIRWVDIADNGYTLDATYHEIYKVQ